MKCKLLFVFILMNLHSNAQFDRLYYTDVDFRETKADTLDIKLDSILLLGIGSSLERIFLDELSNKLIKDFSSKKIVATYSYIGKTLPDANKNYKEVNKDGYKAVLLFRPTDTSWFDIERKTAGFFIVPTTTGLLNIYASRNRTTYQQTFSLQLFKIDKKLTEIWSASVDIDCEPDEKKGSKKVGNKILARFKSNKYIK